MDGNQNYLVVICFHFSIFEPLETTSNILGRYTNML